MVWPLKNRADSLQVDYFYLKRQVCKYLYDTYSDNELDDEQNQAADEVIDEGIRTYYYPPPLPDPYGTGVMDAHEWSFMRPTWEFTTIANQRRYNLPSDWERQISALAYTDIDNNFHRPIRFTTSSRLRNLEYQDTFTTYPRWAATEPAESQGDAPQEQILVLHPTPDAEYLLEVQYQAYARRLTADHPHPLGNQIHAQGILYSVLAIAELRRHGTKGPMHECFMQRLASTVVRDRQRGAKNMGYNGNASMGRQLFGRGEVRERDGLWYNDVTYGEE